MATLSDYVAELRGLCGNRTDIDAVALTAVNAAFTVMYNKDTLPKGVMITTVDVPILDSGGAPLPQPLEIDLPTGMVSASVIAWAPFGETSGFQELKQLTIQNALVADYTESAIPAGWATIGTKIRFFPTMTEAFTVRIMGVRDFAYITDLNAVVPFPERQRSSCIALARSFMSLYLGEVEASEAQAVLARILESKELGMLGGAQVLRTEGVKPYVVD